MLVLVGDQDARATLTIEPLKQLFLLHGSVVFQFENRDQLSITMKQGCFYPELGDITYVEVTYGEYSPGHMADGQDAWLPSASQYFDIEAKEFALKAFFERLQSANPEIQTGGGEPLIDISIYQHSCKGQFTRGGQPV